MIAHLPAICQADEEIWRTMSPLICFDIIEWHRPERVLRQFHMQQGIPPPCLIDMELHLVDRRGRHQYDWVTFHAQYISLWATRSERIATAPLAITTMSFYDPYMQWYRRITRRLIAPVLHRDHMRFHSTASATELLVRAFEIQNHFLMNVKLKLCANASCFIFLYRSPSYRRWLFQMIWRKLTELLLMFYVL